MPASRYGVDNVDHFHGVWNAHCHLFQRNEANVNRRCPPTTRCVTLMGSWDNFKTPYPMKRDSRIGTEHWSGCHNFSDIVCDGNYLADSQPREGGLKMGGTYWYFYKLDDDIEFHNSVEPSTTQCPLLPGQLVNELHVPMVLSGNRSRNTSVSSTSSEKRTMNPQDKFTNPRAVPRPQLSRLKTSPPLLQNAWSLTSTPASTRSGRSGTSTSTTSEPGSADTVRILRVQKKPSLDGPSRSNSRSNSPASALSSGLRSAFRSLRSPRSGSPDTRPEARTGMFKGQFEQDSSHPVGGYEIRKARSVGSSRNQSPSARIQTVGLDHDLILRKLASSPDGSFESTTPSSFQKHRRQRSTSREPSSLRNSLVLEDTESTALREFGYPSRQPLSTLKEVASAQNTPGLSAAGLRTADLEKRLPTLPSTPSSAYPPSAAEGHDSRGSMDMDNLQSHFSTTTIDTSSSVHSSPRKEACARFSGFSSNYADTARSSMYATSIIDDEPMSALLEPEATTPRCDGYRTDEGDTDFEQTPPNFHPPRNDSLPTMNSSSTVTSTTASSLSSSPSDDASTEDIWGGQEAPERFYYQHYRLPAQNHASEVTLKEPLKDEQANGGHHAVDGELTLSKVSGGSSQGPPPHSTNMQQLLHELSYLGDMIHQT